MLWNLLKERCQVFGFFFSLWVEDVLADTVDNKLTVIGKVDPLKIKEKLQEKTSKDVDLVSPQPAKKDGGKGKESEVKFDEKKPSDEKKQPEDEKPKAATTAVLKMRLHCELVPPEKDDGSKKGKKDFDTDSKKDKEKEKESDGDGKKEEEEEEEEKVTAAGGGGETKVESDGRGGRRRRRRQQQQQWPMHRDGEGHVYSQQ
ncbi:hypothetical protein MLD38_020367 [Melastoma candidum]|uniref:Uncharacterized protein n=1 Tax=Melastoma candidum TaxID=119954 RepID=A0ACB9QDM8_9MYRT|nr:hypothetical protein MLD38_020367 [Melastoma candidum]